MGSFWRLVGASRIQFPKALVPFLIVFGWGVVVGKALNYSEPSKFDSIVSEATERAKEIIRQNAKASSQGGFAVDRISARNQ